MRFSFQRTSLTRFTLKPLAELATGSDVVLNLSVTVDMVLPANGVRLNFRKVVCVGETYRVVLVPPSVEVGFALSIYVSATAGKVTDVSADEAVAVTGSSVGETVGVTGASVGET